MMVVLVIILFATLRVVLASNSSRWVLLWKQKVLGDMRSPEYSVDEYSVDYWALLNSFTRQKKKNKKTKGWVESNQ